MSEKLHARTKSSWNEISQVIEIPQRNLRRWRRRIKDCLLPVYRPGPKKVYSINLEKLQEEIRKLPAGTKRTRGSRNLYANYRNRISRRDVQSLINTDRKQRIAEKRTRGKRLKWKTPGLVWALDETEMSVPEQRKVYMVNMRDMCSQYKFSPLFELPQTGKRIAEWLRSIFNRLGAPLFIKRDNGSALNSSEVDQVLEHYSVIPINSPIYYCQYNGAIEHDHSELKSSILSNHDDRPVSPECTSLVAQELNHVPRRHLGGVNSCQLFSQRDLRFYNKRTRSAISERILDRSKQYFSTYVIKNTRAIARAWRRSCEEWLVKNGHLKIHGESSR